jgi:hypothetical protein
MSATVQELNRYFIDLWWESQTSFPDLGPFYTAQTQSQNEKSLLHFLEQVEHILANPPRSRDDAQSAKSRLGAAGRCLTEETLGFTATQLDLLPSQEFSNASEEFVRKARAFDPRLSMEDIYQAGRNAWTAYGLQWLLGLPVQLTTSLFAYSMLYPYTDNYLDDPGIARGIKLAFSERFRRRLAGEMLAPANAQERVIFGLVGMIEEQYSRTADPAVFESLLAIHDAQAQSLRLLRRDTDPGEVDVPGLSFYKGGTSVLADGYLVGGSLTGEQIQYMYGHGIFAQLLDDLEDVEEDGRAGRLSVYSQPSGNKPIDELANRTFHFGRRILRGLDCFDADEAVRALIRRGADLLLIEVIGRTERYYTSAYLHDLEEHSPYRFSFLKEQRNRFIKRYGSQGKLMETFMFFLSF